MTHLVPLGGVVLHRDPLKAHSEAGALGYELISSPPEGAPPNAFGAYRHRDGRKALLCVQDTSRCILIEYREETNLSLGDVDASDAVDRDAAGFTGEDD